MLQTHLLGGKERAHQKKGTYLPRTDLFPGTVVVGVTFGRIMPKSEKIESKSELPGARTQKWEFSRKFENPQNLSI